MPLFGIKWGSAEPWVDQGFGQTPVVSLLFIFLEWLHTLVVTMDQVHSCDLHHFSMFLRLHFLMFWCGKSKCCVYLPFCMNLLHNVHAYKYSSTLVKYVSFKLLLL